MGVGCELVVSGLGVNAAWVFVMLGWKENG